MRDGQTHPGTVQHRRESCTGVPVPQADGSVRLEPMMDTAVVARAVVHMASLPLEANVQFMTVLPTKMPFVGRG